MAAGRKNGGTANAAPEIEEARSSSMVRISKTPRRAPQGCADPLGDGSPAGPTTRPPGGV
jgi:hypothetical protein